MNSKNTMKMTTEQSAAYEACRKQGMAHAARILGATNRGLSDVEVTLLAALDEKLRKDEELKLGFAHVVAKNAAFKVAKEQKREPSLEDYTQDSNNEYHQLVDPGANPSEQLEFSELAKGVPVLAEALRSTLGELRSTDREFLVQFVLEYGFDSKRFGAAEGMSANAVSVRYHRLQHRLFVKVVHQVQLNPWAAELLEYLRSSGFKGCQVVRALLNRVFEFSGDWLS